MKTIRYPRPTNLRFRATVYYVYTDISTGGIFNVSPGAFFDLGGLGTHHWSGTYTSSGGGTVLLEGATLAIGSDGATFNFPQGMFQWTNGTIDTAAGT